MRYMGAELEVEMARSDRKSKCFDFEITNLKSVISACSTVL